MGMQRAVDRIKRWVARRQHILIFSLVVLIALTGGVYAYLAWNGSEDELTQHALAVAETAALSLPQQDVGALQAQPGDIQKPQYQNIKSILSKTVQINKSARYAYILLMKEGKVFFAADSEPAGSADYSPPGQEFTEATEDDKKPFSDGKTLVTEPEKNRWGTWISVFVPIRDSRGLVIAVLGMDYPLNMFIRDGYPHAVLVAALVLAFWLILAMLDRALRKNQRIKEESRKLRAVQEELSNIFDLTPDLICTADVKGGIQKVNRAWETLFGVPADEANHRFEEFVHPDDRDSTLNYFKDLVKTGTSGDFTNRHRCSDGTYIYVEWHSRLLGSTIYAAARDITPHIQAREASRLDVQRQEALLQLNQMACVSVQEIASFVMEEAVQLTGSKIGYIAFLNEDETELTMHAWSKSAMAECQMDDKPIHYALNKTGLWGECVRQRRPIITNDYQGANPWKKGLPEGHVHLEKHLNIPIFDQGRIVMVAGVGNKQTDYDEGDIRQITLMMTAMWRVMLRKRSEDALAAASRLNQRIISSVNAGIIVYDLDRRYTLWNSFMERLSGIPARDIIGKRTEEVFPTLDLGDVIQRLNNALAGQTSESVEIAYQVPGTNLCGWVTEVASPLLDSDGRIAGAIVVSHDITEKKLAEEELKKERLLTDAIFNSVHGILYLYDNDSRLIKWNKKHEEMTGYSADELTQMMLLDWYKDDLDSQTAVIEGIKQAIANGFGEAQANLQKKDGTALPMYFTACPLTIDGKLHFAGMGMDISTLINTQEALRDSEERLRTTLLSVGDGFISTDRHGKVELINKVGEQLTGWTQEAAQGHDLWEVFRIVNEYTCEVTENPVQKVLETGRVIELSNHTMLISRDGTERPIEDSAAPIKDKAGKIHGVVLVFRDFTEKKEKQEKIEYLSYHDALTGLYNRRFYEEEFRRLNTSRNLPISIIMGDVNGLKLVNDAFGHDRGDKLLQRAAQAMHAACRTEDIVARWGGDEFIILLPGTTKAEAESIVKRIETFVASDSDGSITYSISFGWDTKEGPEQSIVQTLKNAEDTMYRNKTLQSESVRGNAINTIISTLHEKSPREEGHSKRTSELCYKIGAELGLSDIRLKRLRTAGLLHDIGKIAIREEILNKPGRLTDSEWNEMKRHPEIGYRILSSSYEMTELGEFVLMHHEKYNGNGYPRNLAGDAIPLEAKIIAVADAFDAMFSDRSYKKMLSLQECIAEIRNNAGVQFDPEIARVFIEKVLHKPWDEKA